MKQKAFTLVEMLISVAVFSLIAGIALSSFLSALQSQRRVLASQEVLNQTSYFMEYVSRALRMAKKDRSGDCISPLLNYEITHSGKGIKFKNYKDECQEFFLENSQLKENKNGTVLELTSQGLSVTAFNLGPAESWGQEDNLQPRITLVFTIQGKGQKPESQPEMSIQTTISQRNLDIKR